MARPRSYERLPVVVAAKEIFWRLGLEGTAVTDLEKETGLSRSSLYAAFGTKRALFDAALSEYLETFIEDMVGPLEAPDAGLAEVVRFFRRLATLFSTPQSQRGCLMINTIADLAGRDPTFTGPAAAFADRYRAAFANALRDAARQGAMSRADVTRRSELLAGATIGVWLEVRCDPPGAARACRAIAAEIAAWAPGHPRRP